MKVGLALQQVAGWSFLIAKGAKICSIFRTHLCSESRKANKFCENWVIMHKMHKKAAKIEIGVFRKLYYIATTNGHL